MSAVQWPHQGAWKRTKKSRSSVGSSRAAVTTRSNVVPTSLATSPAALAAFAASAASPCGAVSDRRNGVVSSSAKSARRNARSVAASVGSAAASQSRRRNARARPCFTSGVGVGRPGRGGSRPRMSARTTVGRSYCGSKSKCLRTRPSVAGTTTWRARSRSAFAIFENASVAASALEALASSTNSSAWTRGPRASWNTEN
mmetsp:Transcript_32628/g.100989  ORF Transcript_32628/g.100989 Transcript_32628/m.100989 type:complete len:200 (+) Transcript_32628:313-912(+)